MNIEMDRLLEANKTLGYVSSALSDLIEESPHITNLKDACTGKYIHSNSRLIRFLDLKKVDDLVGLTINNFVADDGIWKWDLGPGFTAWKKKQPEFINRLDEQVQRTKHRVDIQRDVFYSDGSILIEKHIKLPLFDQNNEKVIAILNSSKDITFQFSLIEIFQTYQKYYPEQRAIQQVLKHLEIDSYFVDLPTLEEIQVLLSMYRNDQIHEIPHPHLLTLKNKLEAQNWYELLTRLHAISVSGYDAA